MTISIEKIMFGLDKLSNNELEKIGKSLETSTRVKTIAKWLHYNLKEPKHINQFIGVLKEIADFGCAGASINRESDYEFEEIKKGYRSAIKDYLLEKYNYNI